MALVSKSWLLGMGLVALAPNLALAHGGSGPKDVVVLLPAPAHRQGDFTVDNDFDGEVEVFLDGRCLGRIPAHQQVRYTARADMHDLVVKRPGTGYVLLSRAIRVYENQLIVLHVNPPAGSLRIDNGGEVALKLAVDDARVWIAPGSSVQVPVTAGNVEVHASIKDPRGEWQAIERTVWVEPGRGASTTLRPDPTVIVITNRDRVPVHALFDGQDAGWIGAGETERVWVRPGPTRVVLTDRTGSVKTSAQVTVTRGNEARVIVQPAVHVVNAVVTTSPPRPGGPIRPDWDSHPDHPGHQDCHNH